LAMADVMTSRIYKMFEDSDPIGGSKGIKSNDDVWAIECLDLSQGASEVMRITLVQRREVKQTWTHTMRLEKMGHPRVIVVSANTTCQAVQEAALKIAQGYAPDATTDSGHFKLKLTDNYGYEDGKELSSGEDEVWDLLQKNHTLSIDWAAQGSESVTHPATELHESLNKKLRVCLVASL